MNNFAFCLGIKKYDRDGNKLDILVKWKDILHISKYSLHDGQDNFFVIIF